MARPNFTNKFNPYLPPFTHSFIDIPFSGLAYRGIFLERLERLSFKGLNISKHVYPRNAFATCIKDKFHLPPVWECECGFYSFKDLEIMEAIPTSLSEKGTLKMYFNRFVKDEQSRVKRHWLAVEELEMCASLAINLYVMELKEDGLLK